MKSSATLFYKNIREKLLFRGDTRPPAEIFQNGLRRRVATYDEYLKKVDAVISDLLYELEERMREKNKASLKARFLEQLKPQLDQLDDMQRELVLQQIDIRVANIQLQNSQAEETAQEEMNQLLKQQFIERFHRKTKEMPPEDLEWMLKRITRFASEPYFDTVEKSGMDQSNSVSVTTQIDVTAHFPEDSTQESYIYFVRSETGFIAYEEQGEQHKYFYSQEMAVRDIPPGDVLGAVKIKRHCVGNNCYCYEISGYLQWNPALENENSQSLVNRKEQIQRMIALRKNQFISVPDDKTPISQDNLNFMTVAPEIVHDLAITKQIFDMVCELVINKKTEVADQILVLAKSLLNPGSVLPYRNKNLVDAFKGYKDYFKNETQRQIYLKLEAEFEQLCNPRMEPQIGRH